MTSASKEFMWYYVRMDDNWKVLFERLLAVMARESKEAISILSRYIQLMEKTNLSDTEFEKEFRKMLEEAERGAAGAPWCEWAINAGWPEIFCNKCG